MKKVIVACGILIFLVVAIIISTLSFTLDKNELNEYTLEMAKNQYKRKILSYVILDSKEENYNASFVYELKFSGDCERHYAVSYRKHLLFPLYRFSSYSDYTAKDFTGILITRGIPYDIAYDISNYSLVRRDYSLSHALRIIIHNSILAVLLMGVISIIIRYNKESR